jgi:hypothetical protein
MLSLKDRPVRARRRAEKPGRHDSATPSKKRADYGVFLPCYALSVAGNPGFLWNSLTGNARLAPCARSKSGRVKPRSNWEP